MSTRQNKSGIKIDGSLLEGLRSEPAELTDSEAHEMIYKYGFFDRARRPNDKRFENIYKIKEIGGDKVIIDTNTALMWQQSGSNKEIKFNKMEKWIKKLNKRGYAYFDDWRLPTLEEAMSLIEPKRGESGLYIDSLFDTKQIWIYTSDVVKDKPWWWTVSFTDGRCGREAFDELKYHIRAVRSVQSSN